MSHLELEAVYRGGVFKPDGKVHLQENQRVRLDIQPIQPTDVRAWLDRVEHLHQQVLQRRGAPMPDSTQDIAEDRAR